MLSAGPHSITEYEKWGVIYTPHGLKIRLSPKGVARVLEPVQEKLDIEGAFLDVELWTQFPNSCSNIAVIVAAAITGSWWIALLAFVITYAIANLFQEFFYSRPLRILVPQFFGSWIISLLAALPVAYILITRGSVFTGVMTVALVIANWIQVSDVLLLLFGPLRIAVKRCLGYQFGAPELALISVLSQQARRGGVELNWTEYTRE